MPAEEEDNQMDEPVQAMHEAPVEATTHKKEVSAAEEVGPVEATAHKEEALPVEATAQHEKLTEAEVAAPLDAIAEKVLPETAQPGEPAARELPSTPATEAEAVHEEVKAGYYHEQPQEEAHQAEPEQAQPLIEEPAAEVAAPAVEEPIAETKVLEPLFPHDLASACVGLQCRRTACHDASACTSIPGKGTGAHVTSGLLGNDSVTDMRVQAAERKAITMNMTLNEEIEGAEAEHRPVSCNFVVDEVRRNLPCLCPYA